MVYFTGSRLVGEIHCLYFCGLPQVCSPVYSTHTHTHRVKASWFKVTHESDAVKQAPRRRVEQRGDKGGYC